MDATLLLLVVLVGVICWCIFSKPSRENKFLNSFPGPTRFPLVGNSWCLKKSEERLATILGLQQKYGNRVPVTDGYQLKTLALFHPDDAGKILASKEVNKPKTYDMIFTDWLGSTVFYAKVEKHSKLRKFLLPAFDYKGVDSYQQNFNEHSKTLIQILKSRQAEEPSVEIRWLFPLCALDVVFQTFVGKSAGCLKNQDNNYAAAIHQEIRCITQRWWSPWLWPQMLWKISPTGRKEKVSRKFLHDFMDKNIQDRKAEMLCHANADDCSPTTSKFPEKVKIKLLDYLIRAEYNGEPGISEKYIRDEISTAIFAGHDTTGSALIFATLLLAAHPDEQARVQQEIDEIFGQDKNRDFESSDITKLTFLECCIKETLRLYPPVPMSFRAPVKDFKLDGETTIPKGVDVLISAWVTHRLPEFWPEPEKFMPSRFFPENCAGRNPYSYIPFSAGPRNCIGQKLALVLIKTILAHIFRHFTIKLESPAESMVLLGDVVIYPKGGLKIKLENR